MLPVSPFAVWGGSRVASVPRQLTAYRTPGSEATGYSSWNCPIEVAVREPLKKGDDVLHLSRAHICDSSEVTIDPGRTSSPATATARGDTRVLGPSLVVEAEHLFQRCQHAIVHVRCRKSDVAERRSSESKAAMTCVRYREEGVLHHTLCVESVVGEHRSAMTAIASDRVELPHSALLLDRKRRAVTSLKTVYWAVDRKEASLKGCERLGECPGADPH